MRFGALWSRIVAITGLVLLILGAIDPLEGSVVILAGAAMEAVGAFLGRSRFRVLLLWAFGLIAVGVAFLFILSSFGGLGGDTGLSMWWAPVLLPYPVGWILGVVGAIRRLMEIRKAPAGQGNSV
jgi:hypothetical protein